MPKAYYSSRLSENISKTPEGFLICRNVPIARVGVQDYLGSEIGQGNSQLYKVTRPGTEVFSPAAMASFEGKPICDEHPDVDVDAANYKDYMKGIVRDVRKGIGEFADCLMADLIIYDATLAHAIEDGKREISCGYDCLWVQTGDTAFEQREIRGNHVAVVDKGRAGHKVAIRDQAPPVVVKRKRSDRKMSDSILKRMFNSFVKDAEPGEILEASKLVNKDEAPAPAPAPAAPVKEAPAMDAAIDARFKKIEDALDRLCGTQQPPVEDADPDMDNEQGLGEPDGDESLDALDSLEDELQNTEAAPAGEEGGTVAPEDINAQDEAPENIEPDTEEDGEAAPAAAAVRDSALECVRAIKPLVAQISNPWQRKKAADSLAMMIRGQARDEQYAALLKAQKAGARRTADSMDDKSLGKSIRDRFNPHYKKSE